MRFTEGVYKRRARQTSLADLGGPQVSPPAPYDILKHKTAHTANEETHSPSISTLHMEDSNVLRGAETTTYA